MSLLPHLRQELRALDLALACLRDQMGALAPGFDDDRLAQLQAEEQALVAQRGALAARLDDLATLSTTT